VAQITGPTHTPILAGRNALISNGNFAVELNGYTPVAGDEWSIIQTNVDLTDALAAFDAIVAAEDANFLDQGGFPTTAAEAIVHNNNAFENNATDPGYVGVDGPFLSEDFSAAPLPAGLSWEVEYLADEVILRVLGDPTLFGDFEPDGDVDIIDFGVFADAFGSTGGDANYFAGADSEPDGDVDIIDFGAFADNFGVGTAVAVPEPSAALLAVAALGVVLRRRGA